MDKNNQGELKLSIHSLRAGSAISKVLEGQSLRKVMYDAYWKNPATYGMEVLQTLSSFIPFQRLWRSAFRPVAGGLLFV